jgi:hypothetical protein
MSRFTVPIVALVACGSNRATVSGGSDATMPLPGDAHTAIDATHSAVHDGATVQVDAAPPVDAAFVPPDPFTLPMNVVPITFAQLASYLAPGATTASGGAFTLVSRTRDSCNSVSGCTAWIYPSPVALMATDGTPLAQPTAGTALLGLQTVDSPPSFSISFAGADVTFNCADIPQTGAASWNCNNLSAANTEAWFAGTYLGAPELSNTTLINWQGVIASDGTYQFVTVLGSQQGTSITGQNNLEQMAIYGAL